MTDTLPTPVSFNEEVMSNYIPLTTESRVRDFTLPETLYLGGEMVKVPRSLRRKDVHYLVDDNKCPIRAAWLHKGLGHLFNSWRFKEEPVVRSGEILRAMEALDETISSLVKDDVLKDKHGPGFMAFVQANENVPKDAIVISERSYAMLCEHHNIWGRAEKVSVTRFPNLGPDTTVELRLIVNRERPLEYTPPTSVFHSAHGPEGMSLKDLFPELLEGVDDLTPPQGVFDAVYLHPSLLKGKLEGDGDGDQVFALLKKVGRTRFQKVNMLRTGLSLSSLKDDEDTLFRKARRVERKPLAEHLPSLFDETPIAQLTYAIRLRLFEELPKHRNSPHPMRAAWKVVAPWAIPRAEMIFDIRKGDFTEAEIKKCLDEIDEYGAKIRELKEAGDPFACTVTSKHVTNVAAFVDRFPTLQAYLDYITGQDSKLGLSLLED